MMDTLDEQNAGGNILELEEPNNFWQGLGEERGMLVYSGLHNF